MSKLHNETAKLLLGGSLLGGLGGSSDGSLSRVPLVGSGKSEGPESVELLLLGGDLSRSFGFVRRGEGDRASGNVGSEVVTLRVSGAFLGKHKQYVQ